MEHIVPRSLGNLHYVLNRGAVCASCNNRFGLIENRILSSPEFVEERRRLRLLRHMSQQSTTALTRSDIQFFLTKMVFQGLYKSRPSIWKELPDKVRRTLAREVELFVFQGPYDRMRFNPVPGFIDRFRLRRNDISLGYRWDNGSLYGQFEFGRIVLTDGIV